MENSQDMLRPHVVKRDDAVLDLLFLEQNAVQLLLSLKNACKIALLSPSSTPVTIAGW